MTTRTDDGAPSSGLDLGLVVVAAGLTAAAAVAAAYTFWNSPPVSTADGTHTPLDADARTTDPRARGRAHAQDMGTDAAARGVGVAKPHKVRNRKRKGGAGSEAGDEDGDGDGDGNKGRGKGNGQEQDQGKVKGRGRVQAGPPPETAITVAVPGAFEAAVESPVVAVPHSPGATGTASKPGDGDKTEDKTNKKRKKKKHVQQSKVRDRDGEDSRQEETEAGNDGVGDNARSKTDKEVPATAHSARHTGDSTDTDALPSVSAPTSTSIRAVGKGSIRASTRAPPSSELHVQQQGASSQAVRESRPLHLLLDTDDSWTHVGRHHRSSKSSRLEDGDGRSGHPVDPIDVTSSDLASTEGSGSPIAERTIKSVAGGGRDTRADLAPRTLAEKLIPKPENTGVEDMLERPDVPTLSRVMRVQPPRANERPMMGFSSWEDSGDLGDESLLVHDADQEDEGEWDIVKSRHHTRPARTTTTTTTTITTITNTTASTPETLTKRQRQNARRRELAKSAKAEAETARQEGLQRHKRELERLRIIEQAHRGGGGTGGGKRQPSGGMRAAVDGRGKLVWE